MKNIYTAILPKAGNFDKDKKVALKALSNQIPNEVVTVRATSLGSVYAQLNHGSGEELEGYKGRSLSVGDVVIDDRDRAWMCDSIGWTELY